MKWRAYLQDAWRSLPDQQRRLVYAVLATGIGLSILTFVLPQDQQLWAVLGLFGLFVVVQGVILWGMWQQRPALRKARQAFLRGDFQAAIQLLEDDRAAGRDDAISLTLLGNAYRQVGRLLDSESVLQDAVALEPSSPLATYGLGRTCLVQGNYAGAIQLIEKALERRAQPVILVELALAHYYAGNPAQAVAALDQARDLALEPHRKLMAIYLRWRCQMLMDPSGSDDSSPPAALIGAQAGLVAWEAEAARFAGSPYGTALAEDVARLRDALDVL